MPVSYWAENFDNSTRASWEEFSPSKEHGTVEWLRFIAQVGKLVPDTNPFAHPDENLGLILINPHFIIAERQGANFGQPTKFYPFVEEYWTRQTVNHSWKLIFAVMLNNANGTARIECYSEKLIEEGIPQEAYRRVQLSYNPPDPNDLDDGLSMSQIKELEQIGMDADNANVGKK